MAASWLSGLRSFFALPGLLFCMILAGFCRIGEAQNPGPCFALGTANPSGINGRHLSFASLPDGIWGVSETHATAQVHRSFAKALRFAGLPSRTLRTLHGAYAPLRSNSEFAGAWTGVMHISCFPCRTVATPWRGLEHSSGRALISHFVVGSHHITGATVYGVPPSASCRHPLKTTEDILETISREVVIGHSGYRFVSGDMNCDTHDLAIFQSWQRLGWVEVQLEGLRRWGSTPMPTSKGKTIKDHVWLSPELAVHLKSVKVEDDHFPDHSVLYAELELPEGIAPSQVRAWALPAPFPWSNFDHQSWSLPASDFVWKPISLSTSFAKWSKRAENCMHAAATKQALPITAGYYGRGQQRAPQLRPLQSVPVRPSRNGEVTVASGLLNRSTHRWFKQLRRLQSFVHSAKCATASVDASLARVQLWASILNAPGFRGGFVSWWVCRPLKQQGAPDFIPRYPPCFELAQLVFDDFQANYRTYEGWACAQRKELLHAKAQKFSKALFAMVSEDLRPPLDSLVLESKHTVTEIQGQEIKLSTTLPNWSHTSALLDGHFAQVMPVSSRAVKACSESVPQAVHSLTLRRVLTSFDEIQAEMLALWTDRWQRHSDAPPDFWSRVISFGRAYLPKLHVDHSDITSQVWSVALHRHNSRTAVGPDGWSISDLRNLPESFHAELLDLFHCAERCGQWPVQLTTGFVCPFAKIESTTAATHYRPIVVVSLLYRLWASIRSRQLLGWLSAHVPSQLHGYMKGKQCSDIWYLLQAEIEATVCAAGSLSGYVADIVKCFNCLGHRPVFELAEHLGVPPPILTAWKGSVQTLQRRFRLRSEVGDAIVGTTGFAEGDPLSCVAITIFDFCFHIYMDVYAPSCRSLSYVDNLELLSDSASQLRVGCVVMATFLDSWDLERDEAKSYAWALDSSSRRVLRACGFNISFACKDLGGQLNYGALSRISALIDRFKSLDRFWNRLRVLPAAEYRKLHILCAKAWPRALYGCQNIHFAESHIDGLRSQAMRAMSWNRSGASSLVRFSLLHGPGCDPGFYQVWEVLSMFHRQSAKHVQMKQWWLLFHRHWSGGAGQGPMRKLLHVFELLDWRLSPSGILSFGPFVQPWSSLSLAALRRLAEHAWTLHVCARLRSRQDFKDLISVDLKLCSSSPVPSAADWPLVRTIQDGTQFTGAFKAKFDPSAHAVCQLCGASDTLEHRCLSCPRYAAAREQHQDCVQRWHQETVAFTHHALVPTFPQLLELWHLLTQQDDATERFEFLPEAGGIYHIFTDGSCSRSSQPECSLAAWSCVHFDSTRVLSAGALPGLVQTINRAELTAVLSVLKWSHRALCTVHVWSDSKYAVDGVSWLQSGQAVPTHWGNEDLWHQVQSELRQSASAGVFVVHHVPSHCAMEDAESPFQEWLIEGNSMADTAAVAANQQRSEPLLRLHRQMCRHVQANRTKADRQLSFLLAVAKASQHVLDVEQDQEDLTLDHLIPGLGPNEFLLASQLPEDTSLLITASALAMFPVELVQELISWLREVDLSASAQRDVTVLELFFAFTVATKMSMPVLVSNTGESRFVPRSEAVAGDAACCTVAGCLGIFDKLFNAILHASGTVLLRRQTSLPKYGIYKPMPAVRCGWPQSMVDLIDGVLCRFLRKPVRRAGDLSRPLALYV